MAFIFSGTGAWFTRNNDSMGVLNSSPPLDKMATILADDNFKWIFLNGNDIISIQISLKFVPRCSNDNESALVQVIAWHRTGDKLLPELMLTQFIGAYMWHWGRMS